MFQGGTQGAFVFDEDLSKAGNFTDFLTLGAPDSSHVIIAFPKASGMDGTQLPIPGSHAETNTSGFHIYPATQIISLQLDGRTLVTEQNDVPYVVGDVIVSPPPSAYVESLITAISTQNTASNTSAGGTGINLLGRGYGWSWLHPAETFFNVVARPAYVGPGSWMDAPPWHFSKGPIGVVDEFDEPLPMIHGGNQRCGGATLFCDNGPTPGSTQSLNIFRNYNNGAEYIRLDRVHGTFNFGLGLTAGGAPVLTHAGPNGCLPLVAGTARVPTAAVTATSNIQLSVRAPGGTQGFLSVGTIVDGTSFVINSTSATETSTVCWFIPQ
jgi:hypothetical protein